jgi:hypothetical protein
VAKHDKELEDWTVALISVEGGRPLNVGPFNIYAAKRTPETPAKGGGDLSFRLRNSNILNPADEAIDLEGQVFDEAWMNAIAGKPELSGDLIWLSDQLGREVWDVAVDLTRRWQNSEPPKLRSKENDVVRRPNGRVVRVMRKRTSGLLLIYPLDPKLAGIEQENDAVIGLALSFPTSETVVGVEYRVNRVWSAEIEDDELYDDDN